MNLKNYDTIIFDLGGVLLNIDYNLTTQAFDILGVTDFNALYSQAKQSQLFDQFETGQISNDDFREQIRKITKLNLTNNQIDDAWNAMLLDFPVERMELLEKLNKSHKLVLMSNTNKIHEVAFTKIIEASFGMNRFRSAFDQVYLSSSIGKRKPDENTFRWILEINSLKAENCFFIDDSAQHIEGSKSVGIQSYLLKADQDIISFFGI